MGMLYSPLTNTPVWDWGEKPDVPQSVLGAVSSLERYGNVPVTDGTSRDTKIPPPNRYVGMVTYNAATDAFEYWNGTAWRKINQVSGLPGNAAVLFTTDVSLTAGKYHDYLINLTVASPGIGLLGFLRASVGSNATPSTYQSANLTYVVDGNTGTYLSRNVFAYTAKSAGMQGDVTGQVRHFLAPGPHTIGARILAGQGTETLVVSNVQLMYWQVSGAATPGQSGVYGSW